MKRRVVFDARMWAHAGIGRYITELSPKIIQLNTDFLLKFLGPMEFRERLLTDKEPLSDAVTFERTFSGIYGLPEQAEVLCRSLGSDLLHIPHFNLPVFFQKKIVVTVHDLIYLEEATLRSGLGRVYVRGLFRQIQKKACAIITVSESTRNVLLSRFPGIGSDRVFVIPEAVSRSFRRVDDPVRLKRVLRAHRLAAPYILFVGSLKPHKNLSGLIEAARLVRDEKGLPHELVVVGRSDPGNHEILREVLNASWVRYLGEVSDADLNVLYSGADVFVLPSFYEGFGLPVLEAMACGTPVIASNRASLPEVVGDAGLTFDPGRVDALSELLYNVLKNRDLRHEMSSKGSERVKLFSWDRAAQDTLQVYRKVLEI